MNLNVLLFIDILMSTAIIVGTIRYIDSILPSRQVDNAWVTEFVVRYLDKHRQWYYPTVLGTIGLVASAMMYWGLILASLTEVICGVMILLVTVRVYYQYRGTLNRSQL